LISQPIKSRKVDIGDLMAQEPVTQGLGRRDSGSGSNSYIPRITSIKRRSSMTKNNLASNIRLTTTETPNAKSVQKSKAD
jgi:hypothetical protein